MKIKIEQIYTFEANFTAKLELSLCTFVRFSFLSSDPL